MPKLIDLTAFNLDELVELNHQVCDRIRYLEQMEQYKRLSSFVVGETVCFNGRDGRPVTGQIIRINKVTATIITGDRRRWKVPPSLLSKVVSANESQGDDQNVIRLQFTKQGMQQEFIKRR